MLRHRWLAILITMLVFIAGGGTLRFVPVNALAETGISTPEQLQGIAGSSGEFILMNDIDASELTASIKSFSGKLNGNGHQIQNLKMPLFDVLNKATIENVELTGLDISGAWKLEAGASDIKMGALAKEISYSSIKNVSVMGNIDISADANSLVGGLCGFASRSNFTECVFDGKITVNAANSESYVGGIAGSTWIQDAPGKYDRCITSGSIVSNGASKAYLGGITGQFTAVGWNQGSIVACGSDMTINGHATEMKAAGIAGIANYQSRIEESFYSSRIDVIGEQDCLAGGIIAYGELNASIYDCYVTDSSFTATVTENGKESYAGGIAGLAWASGNGVMYIENCVAQGNAVKATNAGGIAGCNAHNSNFANCYFNGADSAFGKSEGDNIPTSNVVSMTDQQLSDPSTYSNWDDFSDTWSLNGGELSLQHVPMDEFDSEPDPTPTPTPKPTAQPTATPTAAPQKPPKTGDDSQLGLWMALLVLSVGCGCALLIRNRRRMNHR